MLTKKSSADNTVPVMIVTLLAIIIFMALTLLQLGATKALSKKNDVVHICDSYLEMMMAEGCLTDENKDLLKAELEEVGCKNISFSGTTMSEVGYTEKVCLQVTYSLDLNLPSFTSLFSRGDDSGEVTSKYVRYTTCYK